MKILINYADKQYEPARKWNTLTGRYIARFDKVYEYTPNDIDQSFAKLHHDILSQKRGNGLWLWKPYFVNKALSDCSDGDIIFYCDSGSFFIGREGDNRKSFRKTASIRLRYTITRILFYETSML